MGRRVSLPGAAELFRSTAEPRSSRPSEAASTAAAVRVTAALPAQEPGDASGPLPAQGAPTGPAVPVGADAPEVAASAGLDVPADAGFAGGALHELLSVRLPSELVLDLERARRLLAREHGLPLGRSELLAAAVAVALADFDAHGARSALVARAEQRLGSD